MYNSFYTLQYNKFNVHEIRVVQRRRVFDWGSLRLIVAQNSQGNVYKNTCLEITHSRYVDHSHCNGKWTK